MLTFSSGSTRSVNAQRAVLEALELAGVPKQGNPSLVLINAAVGHDLARLSQVIQAECPGARVLGASCAGVVGREGPGESMHDIALMALHGEGFTIAHVDGLHGHSPMPRAWSWPRPCRPPPSRCECSICWPPASTSPTIS